jgi:hypothetical protein
MTQHTVLKPLEKALRCYAGLYLTIVLFQLVGLVMYAVNVWPGVRGGMSGTVAFLIYVAVILGFARSFIWIRIYWNGSKALSILRRDGESVDLTSRLVPILSALTTLLVVSCILDFLFLPAHFLSDALLPFSVSGWRLGVVELARLLFPQAFGFAALILAFLTRQYAQLLRERSQMKEELDLTI